MNPSLESCVGDSKKSFESLVGDTRKTPVSSMRVVSSWCSCWIHCNGLESLATGVLPQQDFGLKSSISIPSDSHTLSGSANGSAGCALLSAVDRPAMGRESTESSRLSVPKLFFLSLPVPPVDVSVESLCASTGLWRKLRAWHVVSHALLSEPMSFGREEDRLLAPVMGVGGGIAWWMKVLRTFSPMVEGERQGNLNGAGAAAGVRCPRTT
mmetsp:Transcript_56227/g.150169  ORF Transcript_56227/g.150169 Transcript_56227/m.150169 type:complete len:211 (+) Transcript_56227:881-1513(+)